MRTQELFRKIKTDIENTFNINDYFDEGEVLAISKKSKLIKVKFFNKKDFYKNTDRPIIVWCKYLYNQISNNNIVGGMPLIGSRVLCLLKGKEDKYDDVIILGNLTDKTVTSATEQSSQNDNYYYQINPENGGKIEFYKDNSNKQRLFVTGLGRIDIKCTEDLIIDVDGKTEFECSNVKIGNVASTDFVVLKPHLDKYNSAFSAVNTALTSMAILLDPLLGGAFTGTVLLAWNASYINIPDNTNKTNQVKLS